MSAPADPVVVTGLFTLAGVALTATAGAVGSVLRRRWAVEDHKAVVQREERSEFRASRREAYANALAEFNRFANATSRLRGQVLRGEVSPPAMGEQGQVHLFLDQFSGQSEEVEEAIYGATLVAGDEVARLLREMDVELTTMLADSAFGRESSNTFLRLREELTRAMRAEMGG